MEIDLDELLALAAKATPGPWWMDSHGVAMVNTETLDLVFSTSDSMGPVVRHEDTGNLSRWRNDNDATFIASANPVVVAELVRRLKAAEQDAARYQFLRERLEGASFGDDDDEDASITFAVPITTVMSASCDSTVDSAMAAARSGGSA